MKPETQESTLARERLEAAILLLTEVAPGKMSALLGFGSEPLVARLTGMDRLRMVASMLGTLAEDKLSSPMHLQKQGYIKVMADYIRANSAVIGISEKDATALAEQLGIKVFNGFPELERILAHAAFTDEARILKEVDRRSARPQ